MEQEFKPNAVKLSLPSDPKFLSVVRVVVSTMAEKAEFDDRQVKDIVLAVDEACTNVIKHSYLGDTQKEIIVSCGISDTRLEISIRDFGRKVDPETIKHRELEEVKPGGLGVFFIKKIMDEVIYNTSFEVGTKTRLIKYRK